mgnify:FL=1
MSDTHKNSDRNPQKREGANPQDASGDIYNIHEASFREQQLPEEGNERGPWWLYVIIMATFAFGFFYMGFYFGEFSAKPHTLYKKTVGETVSKQSEPKELTKMQLGENVYGRVCQTCHQANGKGVEGAFPSLHNAPLATGNTKTLAALILGGLQGELQRENGVYNGVMPPWNEQLSDKEIAAVATYVRQQFENNASEVSADTVKSVRENFDRSVQWTEEELMNNFE